MSVKVLLTGWRPDPGSLTGDRRPLRFLRCRRRILIRRKRWPPLGVYCGPIGGRAKPCRARARVGPTDFPPAPARRMLTGDRGSSRILPMSSSVSAEREAISRSCGLRRTEIRPTSWRGRASGVSRESSAARRLASSARFPGGVRGRRVSTWTTPPSRRISCVMVRSVWRWPPNLFGPTTFTSSHGCPEAPVHAQLTSGEWSRRGPHEANGLGLGGTKDDRVRTATLGRNGSKNSSPMPPSGRRRPDGVTDRRGPARDLLLHRQLGIPESAGQEEQDRDAGVGHCTLVMRTVESSRESPRRGGGRFHQLDEDLARPGSRLRPSRRHCTRGVRAA